MTDDNTIPEISNIELNKATIDEIVKTYDILTNRGRVIINDYVFYVIPASGIELDLYNKFYTHTHFFKPDCTDWELTNMVKAMFNRNMYKNGIKRINPKSENEEKQPKNEKRQNFLDKLYARIFKDYRKYRGYPLAYLAAYWVEKKVTIKGRGKIKFDELETKYLINKAETAKLIIYMHMLSGFLEPPQKN